MGASSSSLSSSEVPCAACVRVAGLGEAGALRASGLPGALALARCRRRAGALKEASESVPDELGREMGVGRRIVKETLSIAVDDDMTVPLDVSENGNGRGVVAFGFVYDQWRHSSITYGDRPYTVFELIVPICCLRTLAPFLPNNSTLKPWPSLFTLVCQRAPTAMARAGNGRR